MKLVKKLTKILVYIIMIGMGQHYAVGARYPTADGTWWTDSCRHHTIYFPEVKLPFYKGGLEFYFSILVNGWVA